MKPTLLALIGILLAFPLSAQSPGRNPANVTPKKDECSIAGMVVKLAGSEPLRKVTVQLESADDRTRSIFTSTDAGGRFQLKRLDPGRYRLTVMRNGFVTQEYGQKAPDDPGSALTLRPGQDLKDLLFRLLPSAVIAGRVIDEDGEPVPWTELSALREIYSEGKRMPAMEATVTTNDLGEYRLFGLRPGRYFVSAMHAGRIPLSASQSAEQGYAPTFYPGSPDPAKAVALTIKAGEEIPSVEIMLRPLTAFTVRGRVYNMVSKRSNAGVMVQLVPRNTGLAWNFQGGAQANVENQDGTFEIHAVLPGSYTALAYWFDEGKRYQARQALEVGNADVDSVALTIAPGMALSGHVQWEGQPSLLARGELTVLVRGTESEHAYGSSTRVAGDTFTLKDVSEGVYRLNVFGQSQDCFLKSVRFGGTESLDEGFTVRRGVEAGLEVTISSRGARIQGAVADADNLPSAGVWVVLVPDEPRRNQFRLHQARTTDQYGRFDLRGIAPGSYKLFSWEKVEQGEWGDPDFLKPFEEKGERITVQEGDSKSVNLAAIRTASTEQQKP